MFARARRLFNKKWTFFHFGGRIPTPALTEGKFCTAKRTHNARPSVSPAKFDVNRCNKSPVLGEKNDFWLLSKFNTGSLPLCGNPAGNNVIVQRNYQSVGIGHCYCHYTITLSFSLVYHLGLASSSMALSSTGFFFHRTSHHAPSMLNVAALSLLHKLPHMAFHKALFSILFFS